MFQYVSRPAHAQPSEDALVCTCVYVEEVNYPFASQERWLGEGGREGGEREGGKGREEGGGREGVHH